jgi:hypothetical protein
MPVRPTTPSDPKPSKFDAEGVQIRVSADRAVSASALPSRKKVSPPGSVRSYRGPSSRPISRLASL